MEPRSIVNPSKQHERISTTDYVTSWHTGERQLTVTVPEGTNWELSIPRPPKWLLALPVGSLLWYELTGSEWLLLGVLIWLMLAAPRGLFALLAPQYAFEEVSLVHDYLYSEEGQRAYPDITRAEADSVMLSNEEDPRWLKPIVYGGVRLAGWTMYYF